METIIEKLDQMDDMANILDHWSLEEKKQLLEIYLIISKKESQIFDLIYRYHGCDSWEDIFRDYNKTDLDDKARGVKIAIDEINERITEKNNIPRKVVL